MVDLESISQSMFACQSISSHISTFCNQSTDRKFKPMQETILCFDAQSVIKSVNILVMLPYVYMCRPIWWFNILDDSFLQNM